MYTLRQFAKELGVSPATVSKWVKQGKLRPTKILRAGSKVFAYLFAPSALAEGDLIIRSSHPGRPRRTT